MGIELVENSVTMWEGKVTEYDVQISIKYIN